MKKISSGADPTKLQYLLLRFENDQNYFAQRRNLKEKLKNDVGEKYVWQDWLQ
jgi:hypothetical protein